MASCAKCGKKLWFGGYEWLGKYYCSKCYEDPYESEPYVPGSHTDRSNTKTTRSRTTYRTNCASGNSTTTTTNNHSSNSFGFDLTSNTNSDSSLCAYFQNGCCKHGYNSAYNISCDYSEPFQKLCSNFQKR